MTKDNNLLGKFNLEGIPPAPRGVPQIEVTFDIDANGILNVTAKDNATGTQQKITITGSGTLNKDEVERMVKEAEANAERDTQIREMAETKNEAERLMGQVEKSMKTLGDAVSESDKSRIEEKIAALKTALSQEDMEAIKTAKNELESESHRLAEQVYKQTETQGQAQPGAGAVNDPVDEDVIDVDVKDKD